MGKNQRVSCNRFSITIVVAKMSYMLYVLIENQIFPGLVPNFISKSQLLRGESQVFPSISPRVFLLQISMFSFPVSNHHSHPSRKIGKKVFHRVFPSADLRKPKFSIEFPQFPLQLPHLFTLPSGNLTVCYRKLQFSSWENQLFLWSIFYVANC